MRRLQDDEFFALEDLCADFAEIQPMVTNTMLSDTGLALHFSSALALAAKVHKLVCVSEQMATDTAFARQAKRRVATI